MTGCGGNTPGGPGDQRSLRQPWLSPIPQPGGPITQLSSCYLQLPQGSFLLQLALLFVPTQFHSLTNQLTPLCPKVSGRKFLSFFRHTKTKYKRSLKLLPGRALPGLGSCSFYVSPSLQNPTQDTPEHCCPGTTSQEKLKHHGFSRHMVLAD